MAFYGLLRDCRRNCTETDNELSLGHYDRPTRERSIENTNCCKPVEVHLAGAAAVHLGSIIAYSIRVNCPMYLSAINYETPCTNVGERWSMPSALAADPVATKKILCTAARLADALHMWGRGHKNPINKHQDIKHCLYCSNKNQTTNNKFTRLPNCARPHAYGTNNVMIFH